MFDISRVNCSIKILKPGTPATMNVTIVLTRISWAALSCLSEQDHKTQLHPKLDKVYIAKDNGKEISMS